MPLGAAILASLARSRDFWCAAEYSGPPIEPCRCEWNVWGEYSPTSGSGGVLDGGPGVACPFKEIIMSQLLQFESQFQSLHSIGCFLALW